MVENVESNQLTYLTREFYLACFLFAKGYEIKGLKRDKGKVIFVFIDKPERHADVKSYFHDAQVHLRSFVHAISELRSIMNDPATWVIE